MLETKTAYWLLVTSREGVRVLQEAIRAMDAHLTDARNRERFGIAARNEVLAVQVERDRVELDRLRADVAAEVAEANLQRLLDLPPGTRIDPAEPLAAHSRRRCPRSRPSWRRRPPRARSERHSPPVSPRPRRSRVSSAPHGCRSSR